MLYAFYGKNWLINFLNIFIIINIEKIYVTKFDN
jgi:hypothetical protein